MQAKRMSAYRVTMTFVSTENGFGQVVNVWLKTTVRVLSRGNHGVIQDCHSSSPTGYHVNQTARDILNLA